MRYLTLLRRCDCTVAPDGARREPRPGCGECHGSGVARDLLDTATGRLVPASRGRP